MKKFGTIQISREYFISIINVIEKQLVKDTDYSNALNGLFKSLSIELYDNSLLNDMLLHLLKTACYDDNDIIEYFCYELNFGKKYKPGNVIITENNKDIIIDISDAGKLYDYLKSSYNKNN